MSDSGEGARGVGRSSFPVSHMSEKRRWEEEKEAKKPSLPLPSPSSPITNTHKHGGGKKTGQEADGRRTDLGGAEVEVGVELVDHALVPGVVGVLIGCWLVWGVWGV